MALWTGSPRTKRSFLICWTGLATLFGLFGVWTAWEDGRGGDANATVLQVWEKPDGSVQYGYRMTFTLRDGTVCEAERKLLPSSEKVHVGETITVHYSRLSPCSNVERADASRSNPVGGAVTGLAMAAAGTIALIVVTRHARSRASQQGP
jgi:hypothetical protein